MGQLDTFEVNRARRGLMDGLGSVIKIVTRNLDYTDAMHYSQILIFFQDIQKDLIHEFNNHFSLTKNRTNQYSQVINNMAANQNKITTQINKIRETDATRENDLIKYAYSLRATRVDHLKTVFSSSLPLSNEAPFVILYRWR